MAIYSEILLFPVIPFGQMLTHVILKCGVMTTEESNEIRPDMSHVVWHSTPQTSPTWSVWAVLCSSLPKESIFNSEINMLQSSSPVGLDVTWKGSTLHWSLGQHLENKKGGRFGPLILNKILVIKIDFYFFAIIPNYVLNYHPCSKRISWIKV